MKNFKRISKKKLKQILTRKSNLNINSLYEPCVFAHKIKSCTYQKKPG